MKMSRRAIDQNIKRFLDEERTSVGHLGGPHPKWDDQMTDELVKFVEEDNEVHLFFRKKKDP